MTDYATKPQDHYYVPASTSSSSHTGTLVFAALVLGIVTMLSCLSWQHRFEHAEHVRSDAVMTHELARVSNEMKLGGVQHPLQPYDIKPAPLPARQPIITGIIVFITIMATGRTLIFMHRVESSHRL